MISADKFFRFTSTLIIIKINGLSYSTGGCDASSSSSVAALTKEKVSQLQKSFTPCSRCDLIFSVAMLPFFPGSVLVKAFNVRESRGHWWTDIVGYVDTVWFHD